MRSPLSRVLGAASVVAITVVGLAVTAESASAAPTPPSAAQSASQSVIVVLADQLDATPADRTHVARRAGAARHAQDAVLARLAGATPKDVKHFAVGNAFSATVTSDQAAALGADPAVASVSADEPVAVAPPTAKQAAAAAPTIAAPSSVAPAACSSNPAKPILEPEALGTIRARSDDPTAKTAAALGIDGSGVKVAYIADGINPQNQGFLRKNGKSSIVDYKDFYGDGPNAPTGGAEAFGDASSVSAQGNVVYDVAKFANPNVVSYPGGHCYIRIVGVAPGANVVALKAGSELLPNSAILQAIDYAVTVAHVDVINESFGGNLVPDSGSRNTIQLFNDQAVKAGITVTASTGDAGVTSTIGSPATDPLVISAGASTDARLYEQTGYALATRYSNGRWLNDNISSLSSAGITQNGRTIDLSAPGEADWAVCDSGGNFTACTTFQGTFGDIQAFGGTSQSAPFTAGVAALVIQAYRKTHGTSPSPALVKKLLTSTTRDLGLPGDEQGTGRIDARAAVEAALSYPGGTGGPAGIASNLALSTDQLNLTAAPGTTKTGTFTVRNVGPSAVTVLPSTRRYATLSQQTQTVAVPAANAEVVPYPTNGVPWTAQKVTFAVPGGADRLDARIIWQSGAGVNQTGGVVRMSLFAPDGTYAANTRPQGGPAPANYGDVDVRRPAAGTWTAVLYTQQTGGVHFAGNVSLQTTTERALPVGSVRPALFRLAPGASRAVSVTLPLSAVGGDAVYTVALDTSAGQKTAVPVILRALVPTGSGGGTFAGTITGGNARGGAPAQTFSYAFDVPKGRKDLDVSVTLANDPQNALAGILVDPNGQTPSITTNAAPDTGALGLSLQNTVANPIPGRWRYVIDVANPVSGKQFRQDFNGTVAFNKIKVTALGVPNSPSATLKQGKAVTATVTITNPGPAPIAVQTDARTDPLRVQQLAPLFARSTIPLPLSVDDLSNIPAYLVPPDTASIALSAASTVPAQVELSSPAFGIDVFGDLQAAQNGSTISTARVSERAPARVSQGLWTTYVQEIGPFGDGGAPAGSSTLVATARTRGFDSAVSTSTGDPYLQGVDPTADPGTPVILAPGATATIRVTITPTAQKGRTVTGVLHLVTTPQGAPRYNGTGDVLATLPYAYTVR